MKRKNKLIILILSVFVLSILFFVIAEGEGTQKIVGWASYQPIVAGITRDFGSFASPSVFKMGSKYNLIIGADDGKFKGYTWSTTSKSWTKNATINASLPDIGIYSFPSVFKMGSQWHLISGEQLGKFRGFTWNGTGWKKNATINASLPDIGAISGPSVFNTSLTRFNLISGANDGKFKGFTWNGTGWKKNATINASLPDMGTDARPHVYFMASKWHIIAGTSNPTEVYTASWNGTGWKKNATFSKFINETAYFDSYISSSVFQMDSRYYLIYGENSGRLFGLEYNLPPEVLLDNPQNTSYKTNKILFNITTRELGETIGTCKYTTNNGVTNYTLTHGNAFLDYSLITGVSAIDSTFRMQGLTKNGSYLYMLDADRDVYQLSLNGAFTGVNWTAAAPTSNPTDITTDGTYFYFADYNEGSIYKYYMNGTYTGTSWSTSASGEPLWCPYGLDTDGTYIWIGDICDYTINRFYVNGTYIDKFYTWEQEDGYDSLVVDGDYIWVANTNGEGIWQYSLNGTYLGFNTYEGYTPTSADSDGEIIYFGEDWSTAQARIYRYNQTNYYNAVNTWNITNSSMKYGSYTAKFYCNDSINNNVNITQITFFVSTPDTILNSPINKSYNTAIDFNITATAYGGAEMSTCVYSLNGGVKNYSMTNLTATQWNATNSTMNQGHYTVDFYCNDSEDDINRNSIQITFDTVYPKISMVSPANNTNSSYNALDIEYKYTEINCANVTWNDNNGANSTLDSCGTNITEKVWSQGNHNVTIFIRDFSNQLNKTYVSFSMDSAGWLINRTINASLPDIGANSKPNVFQMGSKWHLISGASDGKFKGFTWNGTGWTKNATINASLPDIGSTSAPSVFKTSRYHLISGASDGKFKGFTWNGTGWTKNATINASLPDIGSYSAPSVFNTSTTRFNLIAGAYNGLFKGFTWGGTSWAKNATINASLPDIGLYPSPNVFKMGSRWYMLSGEYAGAFKGFDYNGTGWTKNDTINVSLPIRGDMGSYSFPSVFKINSKYNLVYGEISGGLVGYTLGNNIDVNLTVPANNAYTNVKKNLTSSIWDNIGIKNITLKIYNSSESLVNTTTISFGANIVTKTMGVLHTFTDGVYKWFTQVFDWAGNTATSENYTLTSDTTYPKIAYDTETSINYANLSQNSIYVNVTLTETNFANMSYNLYNRSVPINGLIDWLSLDFNQEKQLDYSVKRKNGTVFGATYTPLGKLGGAYNFDGTNDYISIIGGSSNIDASSGSISLWVKFDEVGTNQVLIIAGQNNSQGALSTATDSLSIVLRGSDNKLVVGWITDAEPDLAVSNSAVTTDTWYHVVLWWSLTTNAVRLYLDNSLQSSSDVLTGDNKNDWVSEMRIGMSMPAGATNYLNGTIDEVRIYNRSLSTTEITNIYNSRLVNQTFYTSINKDINWTNKADGTYYYNVYANDKANNQNVTTTRIVTLDDIHPKISMVSPTNNTNSSDNGLDIKYKYTELNCDNVTWNDNSGANTTLASCGTNITIPTWGQGKHNITIFIRDIANNLNKTYVSFTIDTASPDINLTIPYNNTFTNNLSVNLTAEASDNIGIKNITFKIYNLTSGSLLNTTTVVFGSGVLTKTYGVIHDFVDGIYTWFTKVYDWAGNSDVSTNYTLTIDTVRDIITFLHPTPSDNSFIQDEIIITANITDNAVGNTSSWIDMDGDLVGYWSMDYYNSTGIYDNSSYNNFATFKNGLNLSGLDFGARGKALEFDGTNDYMQVDYSEFNITTQMSWVFWVSSNKLSKQMGIISKWISADYQRSWGIMSSTDNKIRVALSKDGINNEVDYSNADFFTNDDVVLGVVTYNGSKLYFYKNGIPWGSADTSINYLYNNSVTPIYLGTYLGGYWNGSIDEVMIFNRTLSADEVAALYNSKVNNFNSSFSSLSEGVHNYTIYSIDQAGNLNSTSRGFTTDLTKSIITFLSPTPNNNTNLSSATQTITANITDNTIGNISSWIDIDNSLLGYWSMDSYNSTGIYDNSSYDNFGVFNGGISPSNITTGVRGKALEFDGTNDYLDIGASSKYISSASSEFTISGWFNSKKIGLGDYSQRGISIFIGGSSSFLMGFDNSNKAFYYFTSDITRREFSTNVTLDKWYFLTVTYNGTGSKKYINGVIDGAFISQTVTTADNTHARISCSAASAQCWNGSIDEVMIFNRSLSADEVAALYNSKANNYNNTFTDLAQGRHNYTIYSIDQAGNINSTSRGFTIDTASPDINLTTPYNNTFTNNLSVNLTAEASDNIGIKNITFNIYNLTSGSLLNTTTINFGASVLTKTIGVMHTFVEGVYTWFTKTFDWAGNSDVSTNYTLTVDSIYPKISMVSPTNNTNSSDNGLDIKYKYTELNCKNVTWNDGSGLNTTLASCGINITIPTWAEGKHNITLFIRDIANNLNKTYVSFTIDTANPDVNLTTPLDNLNTSDTTQNMTSEISDNMGIKNVTLNIYNLTSGSLLNTTTINFGSAVVTKTLGIFHTFTDGVYKWFYKVYDWASNFDISDNNTIIIDTTFPSLTISSPVNNTNTSLTTLDINYTYTETNCDNVTWNDNSGANTTLASCGTNITIPTWAEGKHNITLFMRDTSNNLGKAYLIFTIDTINPNMTISNTNNTLEPVGDLTVKVNYTATDTNLRSCYYTLRNLAGALHNYPENTSINCAATSIPISSLYFGTFVVQFWAEDYAGNLDDANFTFRTQPEGGGGSGGGGGQQYGMEAELNITLKVRYYNNGLEYIMDDINQYNLSNLTYDAISIDIVGENTGDYNLDLTLLNITPTEFNKSVPKKLESLKVDEKKTIWASELMLVKNFTEKENYTFFVNVKGKNGIIKVYSNDTVKLSFVKVIPKTFWTKVGDLVWESNPLAGILTIAFISIGGLYYYSIIKKKRKKKDEIKEE